MLEISVQTGGLQYDDRNADEVFGMLAAAGFEAMDFTLNGAISRTAFTTRR